MRDPAPDVAALHPGYNPALTGGETCNASIAANVCSWVSI
jgi:hypothetical protein